MAASVAERGDVPPVSCAHTSDTTRVQPRFAAPSSVDTEATARRTTTATITATGRRRVARGSTATASRDTAGRGTAGAAGSAGRGSEEAGGLAGWERLPGLVGSGELAEAC